MKHSALPAFLDGKTKLLLIDGKSVPSESGKTFKTYNPSTGKVLAEIAEAGVADVDAAVASARRAFEEGPWSKFKPFDRQAVLLKIADLVDQHFEELATLDTLDMGGPIATLTSRRRRCSALLRFYAGLATSTHGQTIPNSLPGETFSYTVKEPVGVVAAIIPWNAALVTAIWKIAPALAAGCTVVLKPAEQAPLSPLRLGELCLEAGLPPGVVNVLSGFGEAGAALSSHPGVDKVAFTGSTEVGQSIVRASAGTMKRVTVELGGKSPNIIFADANLDTAVPGAAMAAFANSGQICSAGTRLFVQRAIHEEFVERLGAVAKSFRVGNPLDPQTQMGPLVSAEQLERVTGYMESGKSEGARAIAGGNRIKDGDLADGYFVQPTVFAGVADGMKIAREEIFGPVISVLSFDTVEEVIKRGNDTPYGLGGGVWTGDISNAHKVAKGLRAGTVWVNCYQASDAAVPFGGYKMSGFGRESGTEHMEEYLETKSVFIKIE